MRWAGCDPWRGVEPGFLPIKCALGLDYYGQTWGTMATPVVLISTSLLLELLLRIVNRGRGRVAADLKGSLGGFARTTLILTLYLFYPSVVQCALTGQALSCLLRVTIT